MRSCAGGLHGRYWNLGPSVLALSLGGYLVVQAFQGLALERRLRHGAELPEYMRRRMPEQPDPAWVWGLTYAWMATFLVVTAVVMTQGSPVLWLVVLMLSGLLLSAFAYLRRHWAQRPRRRSSSELSNQ